jgi:trans-aconitate methyltransferase
MTIDDAAELIGGIRTTARETWADLGCGDGTFTLALATSLKRASVIHAMDRDASVLRRIPNEYAGTTIVTHKGDFTKPPWPFGRVDGILLANSLHYVRNQHTFIRTCEQEMNHPRRFLIVEYDTDRANTWVPYPISLRRLEHLFGDAGYSSIRLGTRPSIYQRAPIYAALMENS